MDFKSWMGLVTRLGTRAIRLTSLVMFPHGPKVLIGLHGLALRGSASWCRFGLGEHGPRPIGSVASGLGSKDFSLGRLQLKVFLMFYT
jgi:hypothetical protein